MKIQQSAENYLETIYVLTNRNGSVRSIDIANELGFSKPSVSVAMKALRENGYIACPRQISGQLEWGSTVGIEEIKAGDVLYFSDEPGGRASFGGIYTGSGTMIYSPYPGEKVKSADITAPYWQSRFVTALSL